MKDYSNAFAEVYEILSHLEDDAYKKIPIEFLEVIENNRNKDYEYIVYEDIELKDHEMLPETRAILFNIFRDYLCTSEQKEKIIKMQNEERKQNEEKKRKAYYASKPQEEKTQQPQEKIQLIKIEPNQSLWNKIKNKLKMLFSH